MLETEENVLTVADLLDKVCAMNTPEKWAAWQQLASKSTSKDDLQDVFGIPNADLDFYREHYKPFKAMLTGSLEEWQEIAASLRSNPQEALEEYKEHVKHEEVQQLCPHQD